MKRVLYKTYFSHDIYARQDGKIKNLLLHFRKESEEKAKAALCVYWWIIEDMHADEYRCDKLEVFADDYRCSVQFLKSILEDFELFRTDDHGCYISDRVLKNILEQTEKSEKARKSAKGRWKKDGNNLPKPPDKPHQGEEVEYNETLVNEIIQIFNTEFKKTQIVSNENKQRINKITQEHNLSIETWKEAFKNAKRGWNIKGENKKPNLKTILDKWDLFASDDYFLAPDYEAAEIAKREKEKAEAKQKEKERIESERNIAEFQKDKATICDAVSAIKYLNKHWRLEPNCLKMTKTVKEYMQQYNFTIGDILAAREREGE